MTPIREHVPYLTMDTEDMPSKAPGMNPNRMPINILYSRKVSREKCHNTQFSRMRNILEVLKGTFQSQLQPLTVRRSWMEITNLKTILIVKNSLKRRKNFMYSVFNKILQSDMGKSTVRKYAPSLDAQSVWRDFESHMSTSSEGLNERHRLHAYVSTTAN